MDQAPVGTDLGIGQQPFDRARAQPGLDIGDFPGLLGDVDVDRAAGACGQQARQVGGRGGAQGMRRDADARVGGQGGQVGARRGDQPGEAVEVVAEAQLPLGQRHLPGAAVAVEHRQVGKPDAGLRRRRDDPRRQLGRVGIGRAAALVMEIVELAHRGVAGLQHLQEDQRRDGLDLLGRQPVQEAVHQLAPGPEAVAPRRAPLGHPGHGALEGVAVQVAERRQQRVDAGIAGGGVGAGVDRGDGPAIAEAQPDILRPARGQQGLSCVNHQTIPVLRAFMYRHITG